ncbi:unnamed protein product, partial [Rotaria sp. Silwood1]
ISSVPNVPTISLAYIADLQQRLQYEVYFGSKQIEHI